MVPPERGPRFNQRTTTTKSTTTKSMESEFVRWTVLTIGVLLIAASLSLRLRPSLLPRDTLLASDIFGKIGLVMLCTWLAWPAVLAIWQAPGRLFLLGTFAIAGILFVYRPKTIYVTGPFLAVAALLAILNGWIRKRSGK